ncbi:BTB/POZ domain-containing protein DOT3-like isoform X2 [Diospyros lotus]|uniref:BTB/POZ domain-containing protein DOT3-like isoform X2 n=1 Tax=Diospyros lotus TaxID=55363 RepID=UPI002255A3A3|nr:BTB/POZ domain-containing protein DOT3-like isoform X2 [Diospyros lotus]
MDHSQSSGNDLDGVNQVHNQRIVVPASLISPADDYGKKENYSWFATSQIPTDLSIQLQDVTFQVHKFPLVSRCGYIAQVEMQNSNSNLEKCLKLDNFPALRCASEFLQMTEEFEDGNLISKTEAFLTFVVLSSWKDSVTVLKSCETLSPWAENVQIVRRCCDSIAWKVYKESSKPGEIIDEESWWFDDVTTLRIDHFMRIMTAIKAKLLKPEIIGSCIMQYAGKWLSDTDTEAEGCRRYSYSKNEVQINILSSKRQEVSLGHSKEQRMIVESLITILPAQEEVVPCKFLLWMLKVALAHSASPALISDLEKRVGMVLENADVNDLLLPSYTIGDQGKTLNTPDECTMHNIDVVQRIMQYSLMHEQQQHHPLAGKFNLGKLLDGYLAEIARDPNLSITKFQVLAEALPETTRTCDDGLYRAIDLYLKTHPSLSEHDRQRLCEVMDCEKLSLDACMHAARNDRLPLRTIVQVLFSEQVKMRKAMGKEQTASSDNSDQHDTWTSTKEITTLKAELEKVKMEVQGLQKDYGELQRECEKKTDKCRTSLGWTLGRMKIKSPSFLKGKIQGDETIGGQKRFSFGIHKISLRRRFSVS